MEQTSLNGARVENHREGDNTGKILYNILYVQVDEELEAAQTGG